MQLYAGPKVQSELKEVAVGLNQTVDYGLLWPISKILFAILDGIHKVIGNWGWSIILLTLLVKIALMWVSLIKATTQWRRCVLSP